MAAKEYKADTQDEAQKVDPVDAAIEQWKDDVLRNSPLSRDTEAWNYLMTEALPSLGGYIRGDR